MAPLPKTFHGNRRRSYPGAGLRSVGVSQFLVSTRPNAAPPEIVRSLKGRLQYQLRKQLPKAFHRNYSIHSVGAANLAAVEVYVASQLAHHRMADERIQIRLAKHQIHCPEVDLSIPMRGSHGEYRFNLHVVLVNQERWTEVRDDVLTAIREMLIRASRPRGGEDG
jgi:hypothetical protein